MNEIRAFLSSAGVALALLTALPSHSSAQLIPDQCKIYFSGKAGIPPPVQTLMQARHDSTAEGCLGRGILHRYTSISNALAGSFNVCSYFKYEQRIFDDRGNDITSQYNRRDTQMFMAIAGPNCPAQDDAQYVGAGGVSEGVFIQLKAFADQLSLSPLNFDAAFAMEAKQSDCGPKIGPAAQGLTEEKEREYRILRAGITANNPRSRFRLWGVGLRLGSDVSPSGLIVWGCSGYALSFSNPDNPNESWSLYVEFTPTGLRVVGYDLAL